MSLLKGQTNNHLVKFIAGKIFFQLSGQCGKIATLNCNYV